MIYNDKLENYFKVLYENTELKLLQKLAKKGVKHKIYTDIVQYFQKKLDDNEINIELIYEFMDTYNLEKNLTLINPSKTADKLARLFLFYIKDIKLPDLSLGVCMGEFYIAGTQFIDNISELIQELNLNDKVNLIHEKNNPYDIRAVKILTSQNIKLGYMPKNMNHFPSFMLENNAELFGVIKKLDWQQDNVSIKIMLYCDC